MIKFYLKTFYRNFRKNKTYGLISVIGLSVGMAAFMLMALYVHYETNWDTFHHNLDRIYRVEKDVTTQLEKKQEPVLPYPLALALKDSYPEIEETVTFYRIWQRSLSSSKERIFVEKGMPGLYADHTLFKVFTFEFLEGAPETALAEPYSMVLTEDMARKYFPGQDPLGKSMRIDDTFTCKVTAVVKNPPANSYLQYKFLISMTTLNALNPAWDMYNQWDEDNYFAYLLLKPGTHPGQLEEKIAGFLTPYRKIEGVTTRLVLKPFSKMHFSTTEFEMGSITNSIIIQLFSALAVFILLVAGINFMNLSTAYSVTRAKEIGIKKVLGGRRGALIRQFLSESVVFALVAMLAAFFLAELALPFFNSIVLRPLTLDVLSHGGFFAAMLGISLVVGLLSGIYPAMVLSSFKPAAVLKSKPKLGSQRSAFGKLLIAFQFVVSFVLITTTTVVYLQLDYIRHKSLGFDHKNTLTGFLTNTKAKDISRYEALKDQLVKSPYVTNATMCHNPLLLGYEIGNIRPEGGTENERVEIDFNVVDHDFIDTHGITIKDGRKFSKSFPTDKDNAVIINETAARTLGWDDAVGKRLTFRDHSYTVIGVAKDFHIYTLIRELPPYMMVLSNPDRGLLSAYAFTMRLPSDKLEESRRYVEKTFREFFPAKAFELMFLEDVFDANYREVLDGIGKTTVFFSLLTIFIAAIGLFSLVSFSTNRRTKEIGIRKVLGASMTRIYSLLVKQFLKLLAVAVIIGCPLSFFFLREFLQKMPYRVDIQVWVFLMSGAISLLMVVGTVSFKAMHAASANPVEALRYE